MRANHSNNRPVCELSSVPRGLTLIELIVVITITGILAAVLGVFIVRPIQGYEATLRRAELVDAAEMALRHTARDIRRALPNSVRVTTSGGRRIIEMLNTVDGARYREAPGTNPGGHNHANPRYRLRINAADDNGFNIVGFFRNIPIPCTGVCATYRLSIYNQGVPNADAYTDGDESLLPAPNRYVITRPSVTTFGVDLDGDNNCDPGNPNPNGDDEHCIIHTAASPAPNFRFRWASPNQRVFIVDHPITYICDPGARTITRYWNYPIRATQPTNPAIDPLSGGNNALLTTPVTACAFSYSPGTNQRFGLVTLDITVQDATGEQVRLLHQVHVDNSP